MKVYVAGPMRGYPEFNFPAFMEAAAKLRADGHEVFNPAERDLAAGFDPTGLTGSMEEMHGFNLREALAADLEWICKEAEAIYLLDGWTLSKGASAEYWAGRCLGLAIMGATI